MKISKMKNKKRKICVVVASRANYGRVKHLMFAIKKNENLQLQIILGASALLYKYGNVVDVIRSDGFRPDYEINYLLDGENLITQAKSTGIGIIELSSAFAKLKPDIVVTVADRFETMATAIAASYMNIPLAHIQGGEVSGNIDDSVRHAITKLSHIHFPATQKSKDRLIKLGEEDWRIFNYGCPSIDIIAEMDLSLPRQSFFEKKGTGIFFNPSEPYILILQHPVTTSYGMGKKQMIETLEAVKKIKINKLVLWPNADAGSNEVSKVIRDFYNQNSSLPFSYFINFTPEVFVKLIANSKCLVGNSSSFIREGAYLGTPAVIIGDRQIGREHGENVIYSNYDRNEIFGKIKKQIENGSFRKSFLFGKGDAGLKISKKLETIELKIHKEMTY